MKNMGSSGLFDRQKREMTTSSWQKMTGDEIAIGSVFGVTPQSRSETRLARPNRRTVSE
jgi:hypothetical protein